jgi:hypothetical protein
MKCIICGCTDEYGCAEGCGWVVYRRASLPLCSSCMGERNLEIALLLLHLAEIACDGLHRLWKPKIRPQKDADYLAISEWTCVSVKSRRKCEPCRARLLIGAA